MVQGSICCGVDLALLLFRSYCPSDRVWTHLPLHMNHNSIRISMSSWSDISKRLVGLDRCDLSKTMGVRGLSSLRIIWCRLGGGA